MNITRAVYLPPPRRGIRIEVASQPAIIKPIRKSLLERGIAVLTDARDAVFPWTINLAYHLDGDPTNLDPEHGIVGGTTDPVIVCLARRYWQAIHVGSHPHGWIRIPTREEALEELENSSFWPKPETLHAAPIH
jgi:hypothetical protein